MTATITVRAVSQGDGTVLSDHKLGECHASAAYKESETHNTVSPHFLRQSMGYGTDTLEQLAESGDHDIYLEWTPHSCHQPLVRTRHTLSPESQTDVVFQNEEIEKTAGLECHRNWMRELYADSPGIPLRGEEDLVPGQLSNAAHKPAQPWNRENHITGSPLDLHMPQQWDKYSRPLHGQPLRPSKTELLPACCCEPCELQLEALTPSLISSPFYGINGILPSPCAASVCATTLDCHEESRGDTSPVQLGTDDPQEPCPDIDFCEVELQRQVLDEIEYRRVRNAELEYKRTGDLKVFRSLLAPFIASGDGEGSKKPVWIWSQAVQRWYCKDPKTKTILWCPTSGGFP